MNTAAQLTKNKQGFPVQKYYSNNVICTEYSYFRYSKT